MLTCQRLEKLYQEACELELLAFKPGNVSIYADGHDMTVQDFRQSAQVSAKPLCDSTLSLGQKIYYAVAATKERVACNTNLGILLLSAPLLQAAAKSKQVSDFKEVLAIILTQTTLDDADWVFKGISLASPGGLGESADQDVRSRPTMTLTAAMQLSESRDFIAKQYATNFKDVFDFGVLRYNQGLNRWGKKDWAAVWVYTGLLSQYPDSHIERKYGNQFTEYVTTTMLSLDAQLAHSSKPELLMPVFYDVDRAFKLKGINPGTTADLTVAIILAALLIDCLSAI